MNVKARALAVRQAGDLITSCSRKPTSEQLIHGGVDR
jgi:hypothetical protein